jgi:hypothetical protein
MAQLLRTYFWRQLHCVTALMTERSWSHELKRLPSVLTKTTEQSVIVACCGGKPIQLWALTALWYPLRSTCWPRICIENSKNEFSWYCLWVLYACEWSVLHGFENVCESVLHREARRGGWTPRFSDLRLFIGPKSCIRIWHDQGPYPGLNLHLITLTLSQQAIRLYITYYTFIWGLKAITYHVYRDILHYYKTDFRTSSQCWTKLETSPGCSSVTRNFPTSNI